MSPLSAYLRGAGLALCTRRRLSALELTPSAWFADEYPLAELRLRHPEWRADTLAPVSAVLDPFTLTGVTDSSLDYLASYEFFSDHGRIRAAFASAGRVLKPGGALVIPINLLNGPYAAKLDAMASTFNWAGQSEQRWCFEKLAKLVVEQEPIYAPAFEFDAALSVACEAIFVLVRSEPPLQHDHLVEHLGRVFVVDGDLLRYVSSPGVLAMIRRKGQPVSPISDRTFSRAAFGPTLSEVAARDLIARRS